METYIIVIYAIGVIVTLLFMKKVLKRYDETHQEEVENRTKQDKKYIDNFIICYSLFSWLAFFSIIMGFFVTLMKENNMSKDIINYMNKHGTEIVSNSHLFFISSLMKNRINDYGLLYKLSNKIYISIRKKETKTLQEVYNEIYN